jgi:hypothetical protein
MISFLNNPQVPRGIRNNNPGNLKITPIKWQGKISPSADNTFEQFEGAVYGIRALFTDVMGDYANDGSRTIMQIIKEFAPDYNEAYIKILETATGVGRNSPLPATADTFIALVRGIMNFENGKDTRAYYPDSLLLEAYSLVPSVLRAKFAVTGAIQAVQDNVKKKEILIPILFVLAVGGVVWYNSRN